MPRDPHPKLQEAGASFSLAEQLTPWSPKQQPHWLMEPLGSPRRQAEGLSLDNPLKPTGGDHTLPCTQQGTQGLGHTANQHRARQLPTPACPQGQVPRLTSAPVS